MQKLCWTTFCWLNNPSMHKKQSISSTTKNVSDLLLHCNPHYQLVSLSATSNYISSVPFHSLFILLAFFKILLSSLVWKDTLTETSLMVIVLGLPIFHFQSRIQQWY
jgi:hypothetical protein